MVFLRLLAFGTLHFIASYRGTALAATNQEFTINYNFDTLRPAPGFFQADAPELGEYDLLRFGNIEAVTLPSSGVRPHTPPNAGAFTRTTTSSDPGGPFQITSQYPRSSILFFQAISWWYGCNQANPRNNVAVATPCTITATGFTPAGQRVVQQVFQYTPPAGNVRLDMTFGTFYSQFSGLGCVVFEVANNNTVGVVFDDLIANIFQSPSATNY